MDAYMRPLQYKNLGGKIMSGGDSSIISHRSVYPDLTYMAYEGKPKKEQTDKITTIRGGVLKIAHGDAVIFINSGLNCVNLIIPSAKIDYGPDIDASTGRRIFIQELVTYIPKYILRTDMPPGCAGGKAAESMYVENKEQKSIMELQEVTDKDKLKKYKEIAKKYLQAVKLDPKDKYYRRVRTALRNFIDELK